MNRWLGVVVTLSLTAAVAPRAAVAQSAEDSRVSVHPGIMFASVDQSTFEPVTSLAGQDVFLRVDAPDARVGPTALVSYRLIRIGQARLHGTVGAGFASSGHLALIGLSVERGRVFFTLGAATALVQRGAVPVEDEVFGAGESRTLYADLSREREWGLFVGVTFGIVPW